MKSSYRNLGSIFLLTLLSLNGIKCDYCYGIGQSCPGWFQPYSKTYCCGSGSDEYCCDYDEYYGTMSGGAIAGIVIGLIIFITVVVASIVACVYCCAQPHNRNTTRVVHNQVMPSAGVTVVSNNHAMTTGYGYGQQQHVTTGYGYGQQQHITTGYGYGQQQSVLVV